MKKICIVCPYPQGVAPSQRLKFEQYYHEFENDGWEVSVFPFQTKRFWKIVYQKNLVFEKIFWTLIGYVNRIKLLFQLRKYDVVYIHLFVTPFGMPLFEWLYCKIAKRIVFDIDDMVYLGNTSESNSWISKLKGKKKPIVLIKCADFVITTTPYLVNFCKKYNENVIGIPPSLDEKSIFPTKESSSSKLTIGWSGSHSTLKYLSIVESTIRKISQKYAIEFLIFGAKDYSLKEVETTAVPWTAEIENKLFNEMDIAIYPQEKELWSEGKYGGKMIQYLAAGLPMVISNSNSLIQDIVSNMEDGIIVENNDKEWEDALLKLIENKTLREKIGKNARKLFLTNFSLEVNKVKYLKVLNSTLQ